MVGNPSHAAAIIVTRDVVFATNIGHSQDNRLEDVDVKITVDALQHRTGSFKTHASVNVATGKWTQIVGRHTNAVELRKDKVPYFNIASIGHFVKDLAAWPTNAIRALRGSAGRPEVIVLAHTSDSRRGHAHLVRPDCVGLGVVLIDCDRKFFRRDIEPVAAGKKFPGPEDSLAFKIVAKTKVAQHFKEGVVPGSATDVLDVACAQAFLTGCCLGKFEFALAKKVVFELVHPRGREQHRRIPSRHEHIARPPHAPL